MRSLIALIICLFLVFNADTSPIHEYFERPSVEPADRSQQIVRQVNKSLSYFQLSYRMQKRRSFLNESIWDSIIPKFENLGLIKRFLTAPNDVIIEDNLIEDEETDKTAVNQISSVLCEAGKTSGWLQCNDPTGVGIKYTVLPYQI